MMYLKNALLVLLVGLLASCVSALQTPGVTKVRVDRKSELGRKILELDQIRRDSRFIQKIESYRKVARRFVMAATMDDLDEMIDLTSLITIHNSQNGEASVRKHYSEQIIPRMRGADIEWGKEIIITDDRNNQGFAFFAICHRGSQRFLFSVTVMREKMRFVVINFLDGEVCEARLRAE